MIDWNIEMHLIIVCALHISTAALMPSIARIFSSSKKVPMAAPFVSLRSIDNDVNNNNMEICELEREVTSIAAVGPEKTFRAHNFIPNSFLVPQFLATNCHWQTIIGSKALQNKIFGVKDRSFHAKKERILTPDGDFFDVEFTEDYQNAKGLVIISHGLESSARGEHVSSFAKGFISKGFGCCLVNYRGCSGEPNRRVGAYHLGFTTDLKQLISELNLRHPNLKLFLCGFSLGGNVSLKLLGELGSAARTEMNLLGAAVTCVPFDPIASQGKLDKGFNRAVYSENFLASLKAKAEYQIRLFPGSFDIESVRRCRTIGEFDEAFICRIYGFQDKVDYYRNTGSKWWLSEIRVPTVVINARDDPFIEEASLPRESDLPAISPVRLIYHDHGGHCGFNTNLTGAPDPNLVLPSHGWLAEELARAIEHIHDCYEKGQ